MICAALYKFTLTYLHSLVNPQSTVSGLSALPSAVPPARETRTYALAPSQESATARVGSLHDSLHLVTGTSLVEETLHPLRSHIGLFALGDDVKPREQRTDDDGHKEYLDGG